MSQSNTKNITLTVLVAALGYFVDIYDLLLFSIVRIKSLTDIGVTAENITSSGILLLNSQMVGMLIGGVFWGIIGDKKGRLSVLFGSIILYSLANIANGFVYNVTSYAILRFIAGIGLAGELGAGITLVNEIMSKEKRGYGVTIVAVIGLLGAVVASFVGDYFSWRTAYFIGGGMGISLLLLRIGVAESGMFSQIKHTVDVKRGSLILLLKDSKRLLKYIYCILIGIPIWFIVSIPITLAPELGKALKMTTLPSPSQAVMYCYIGLAVGDLISGLLSQFLRSRLKVIGFFILIATIFINWLLFSTSISLSQFYIFCFMLGVSGGYWAIFVTLASEQFGTNLRATVTTSVPNFVRGAVVLITLTFEMFSKSLGFVQGAFWVGLLCVLVAFFARFQLKDTFGKDLNYNEL